MPFAEVDALSRDQLVDDCLELGRLSLVDLVDPDDHLRRVVLERERVEQQREALLGDVAPELRQDRRVAGLQSAPDAVGPDDALLFEPEAGGQVGVVHLLFVQNDRVVAAVVVAQVAVLERVLAVGSARRQGGDELLVAEVLDQDFAALFVLGVLVQLDDEHDHVVFELERA